MSGKKALKVLTTEQAKGRGILQPPPGTKITPEWVQLTGHDATGDTWTCGSCGGALAIRMGPRSTRLANSAIRCPRCNAINDSDPLH